jgi:hypothetical protein
MGTVENSDLAVAPLTRGNAGFAAAEILP